MPLVDLFREKWRRMRAERTRGEESRRQVFESLNAAEKDRACREIARWLKEADISSAHPDDYYYSQAKKRIAGFRWQLYKLNRPFIWLEKKIIEPLDFWSDRANVFQFFSKLSPIIEAIGVLAIPFVIFFYESRREERQIKFEQQREERQLEFERNLVSAQAEVRQQQAVRDYLSQITTVYLEVKQEDPSKEKEELKKLKNLLEATTLALFDELSISEDFRSKSSDGVEFDREAIERDRKGEVIDFLSNLGWINSSNDEEPFLSLRGANLSQANLRGAKLEGADLVKANLFEADLFRANLIGTDLTSANLKGAFLSGTIIDEKTKLDSQWRKVWEILNQRVLSRDILRGVNLSKAYLRGANLSEANLFRANLSEVNLSKAYLFRTNLSEAKLIRTELIKADLRGTDLRGANLRGAYLIGANLSEANLIEADLRGANLRGAYLIGANLSEANLIEADLRGANLSEANLSEADLRRTTFCKTIMPDNTINNSNCDN